MKNFKRRLIALSLALSMLNASGCSKNNNKNDNSMSSASTSTSVWDETPNAKPEEKESSITVSKNKDLSEIVSRYRSLIMAYNGLYPYSEYYLTHEEFLNILEGAKKDKDCSYSYKKLDEEIKNVSKKICENTREAIESPSTKDILATLEIDIDLEDITSEGLELILDDILSDIFKNATNDINEDFCVLSNIRIIISNKNIGDFGGIWLPSIDTICVNYPAIVKSSQNTGMDERRILFLTIKHELEHVRQTKCKHNLDDEWTDFVYLRHCVPFIMESSAESSLYNLGIDSNYKYEGRFQYSYSEEREYESILLLLGITNESVDGYYNAIFDSDLEALFKYLGLNTLEEQETFFRILYAFDTKLFRTYLSFLNVDKPVVYYSDLKDYGGYGCYTDVFKLSLQNLIDYTCSNPDFTLQDNLLIFDCIRNIILSKSKEFKKDEKGDLVLDDHDQIAYVYDKDFANSFLELESIYLDFLCEYYSITREEVSILLENDKYSYMSKLSMVYESGENILAYDFDTNSVFCKYPVIKSILFANGLVFSDHDQFLKSTGMTLERVKNS